MGAIHSMAMLTNISTQPQIWAAEREHKVRLSERGV